MIIHEWFQSQNCVIARVYCAYLVVRDGRLSVVGQLHECRQVGAQVRLTAHQQHLGVGTKLLDLPFPLWRTKQWEILKNQQTFSNMFLAPPPPPHYLSF